METYKTVCKIDSQREFCCMAQETQTGALYQWRGSGWGGRWEGGWKGKGYIYTYGWLMLRFDRKQQNSVKQLSFNKKNKLKRKKKIWILPPIEDSQLNLLIVSDEKHAPDLFAKEP